MRYQHQQQQWWLMLPCRNHVLVREIQLILYWSILCLALYVLYATDVLIRFLSYCCFVQKCISLYVCLLYQIWSLVFWSAIVGGACGMSTIAWYCVPYFPHSTFIKYRCVIVLKQTVSVSLGWTIGTDHGCATCRQAKSIGNGNKAHTETLAVYAVRT